MFECISFIPLVRREFMHTIISWERKRGGESLFYQQKYLDKLGICTSERIIHTNCRVDYRVATDAWFSLCPHSGRTLRGLLLCFDQRLINARADTMWTLASAHIDAHYTREALIRRESLYCTHVISFKRNEWTKRTRRFSLLSASLHRREKQRDLSDAVGSWLEKFHAILSRSARPKTIALTRPPFSANALHETGNQICTRAYSWLVLREIFARKPSLTDVP